MQKSYFAENLKALRKYKKITLEELSEAINISKSAISDYENDKFSPSLNVLKKVADYFNVNLDNLSNSDILEISDSGTYILRTDESIIKQLKVAKEFAEVLEKQKNELYLELTLQKQKVESLHLQMKLQEQLKDGKISEIELLKYQIMLLEDKIKLIQKD